MEEAFQRRRADFEELRAMMDEDSTIQAIRTDWLAPIKGVEQRWGEAGGTIDSRRWDQYRAMFRRLGLEGGISRGTTGPCSFYFGQYGSGNVVSGSSKGYAVCASVPSPLVEDLDHGPVRAKTIAFRALRDDWYLFYEFN